MVDRRIVVDEAYEHATRLASRLAAASDGILYEVAQNLRAISATSEPLTVHRMRGGTLRDIGWTRNPSQVAIILSTVDQIGSRILFRGYGVTPRMAPIHAALAANDSLILLDEAHCARAFASTALAVEKYRERAEEPLHLPFQIVVLSATFPPDITGEIEHLGDDDRQDPILGARVRASKPARLSVAKSAAGDHALPQFARELASEARAMVGRGRNTVAVMVNRVKTARLVYEALKSDDLDVLLMIGRMRPIDRDVLIDQWHTMIHALESGGATRRNVVLVSTQCLEVGANLSFEGLVTECASLDALRQRFGRLNRFAERSNAGSCEGVVMIQSAQRKETDDDPVYGQALANTWQWLESIAEADTVDFGIDAMDSKVASLPDLTAMLAPAPQSPVMLPAYLDFWAQTSPRPTPDPDPALFLHGLGRGSAEVQVCWRADLPFERPEIWKDIVDLCPPTAGECAQVPLWIARDWINGSGREDGLSDVESAAEPEPHRRARGARDALRWGSVKDRQLVCSGNEIAPGDTIVLSAARAKDMSASEIDDEWGVLGHFHPRADGRPILDLAEISFLNARDLPILRITRSAIALWAIDPPGRLAYFGSASEELSYEQRDELHDVLQTVRANARSEIQGIIEPLIGQWRKVSFERHLAGGFVLKGSERVGRHSDSPMPEDVAVEKEEIDTSGASRALPLAIHLRDVGERSLQLAESCGLPSELAQAIGQAGHLHDVGKADSRFQLVLHRGDEWAAAIAPTPLAKSPEVPLFGVAAGRIQARVGLPEGFRHELVSVRMVENSSEMAVRLAGHHDLVLHLVATHHGFCRPWAPVVIDEYPHEVRLNVDHFTLSGSSATALERIDSGVADRFWRLVRRYGWWGLAFLETMMRLADHLESDRREREGFEPSSACNPSALEEVG